MKTCNINLFKKRLLSALLAVVMITVSINPGFGFFTYAYPGDEFHAVTFVTMDDGGYLELDEHLIGEASPSDALPASGSNATASNASSSDADSDGELLDGEIYNDLGQEAANGETVTVYVKDGEPLKDYQIPDYVSKNRTRGFLGWVGEDGTEYSAEDLIGMEVSGGLVFRTLTECYADSAEIPAWYAHVEGTDRYAFTDRNGTEHTRVFSSRNGGAWFEYADGELGAEVDAEAEYYTLAPYLFVSAEPDDAAWAKLVEESGIPYGAVQDESGFSSYSNCDGTSYDVQHVFIAPESDEVGASAGATYERYMFYGYADNDTRDVSAKLGWYDADQEGHILYIAPVMRKMMMAPRLQATREPARDIYDDARLKTLEITTYEENGDWIIKVGVTGDFDQLGKWLFLGSAYERQINAHYKQLILLFNGAGVGKRGGRLGRDIPFHASNRSNYYSTKNYQYYRSYDYCYGTTNIDVSPGQYINSKSRRNIEYTDFCDRFYYDSGHWYIVNPSEDLTGITLDDIYQHPTTDSDQEADDYLTAIVGTTTVNGRSVSNQTDLARELVRHYILQCIRTGSGGWSTGWNLPEGNALSMLPREGDVALKKAGYVFEGWYDALTGGTKYTNSSTMPARDLHLYAHYRPVSYSVAFDANGGSGRMAGQSLLYDESKQLNPNAFARTGYTFAGWATSASGAVKYTDGQSVKNLTDTNNATVTLYAVWTPITYAVRFNANSGSGRMANQTLTYDKPAALTKNDFDKTGYAFNGWSRSAGGAAAYSDGATVTNLSSTAGAVVDLYATWKATNYAVVFNANGGSGRMASQTADYDKDLVLSPSSFTRTGYTFAGWATSADGAVAYSDSATVRNLSSTGGSIELYAVWTPHQYTVIFDKNGGYGTMEPQAFVYDVRQALSESGFTRTGYTFAGWAAKADGDTVYTDKETVMNLSSDEGAEVTLYAAWEPIRYSVQFDANGGEGTMRDQPMVYDTASELFENGFTRTGYTFRGWAVHAEGEVVYADKAQVRNLTSIDGKRVALYAVWEANGYTVEFDPNGGEGAMEPQKFVYDVPGQLTANAFAKTGYTFAGWSEQAGDGDVVYADQAEAVNLSADAGGTVTVYAVWEPIRYVVEFDANGGTGAMEPQSYVYDETQSLTQNALTREGYTFVGWSRQVGDGALHYILDQTETDITVYPPDGAPETETVNDQVEFRSTTEDPDGRIYKDMEEVRNLTDVADGVVILYAIWDANKYTVEFDANGGSGAMEPQTLTYDSRQQLSKSSFNKTGFSFTGWATRPDAESATILDEDDVINLASGNGEKIKLYAVWGINTYDVIFAADNVSGSTARTLHLVYRTTLGSAVKTLTEGSGGYTFLGWTSNKPEKIYTLDDVFDGPYATQETQVDVGGATYYPVWQVNRYKATFDAGEGSITNNDGSATSTTSIDRDYRQELGTLPTPTRNGFRFNGWVDSQGNPVTDSTTMAASAATYTAQWTRRSSGSGSGGGSTPSQRTESTVTAESTTAGLQPTTVPETTTIAATTVAQGQRRVEDDSDSSDDDFADRNEAEETLAASTEGTEEAVEESVLTNGDSDETTTVFAADDEALLRTLPAEEEETEKGFFRSLARRFGELPVIGKVVTLGVSFFLLWLIILLLMMAKRRLDEAEAERKRRAQK